MKRLTKKLDEPLVTKYLHYDYMKIGDYDIDRGNYGRITDDMVYNKLGRLEDVEEELGIDLVDAIKLCKKVNAQKFVYTKENWGIDTVKFFDDLDIELFTGRLYVSSRGIYISLKLKEYGETWALTRKELEGK